MPRVSPRRSPHPARGSRAALRSRRASASSDSCRRTYGSKRIMRRGASRTRRQSAHTTRCRSAAISGPTRAGHASQASRIARTVVKNLASVVFRSRRAPRRSSRRRRRNCASVNRRAVRPPASTPAGCRERPRPLPGPARSGGGSASDGPGTATSRRRRDSWSRARGGLPPRGRSASPCRAADRAARLHAFSHRRLVDAAPARVFPDRNQCHVTTLARPAAADPADPKTSARR